METEETEGSCFLRLPNETILHILCFFPDCHPEVRDSLREDEDGYVIDDFGYRYNFTSALLEAEEVHVLHDIASVSLTCKRLSLIVEDDTLWHSLCDRLRLCYLPPSFYATTTGVITVDDGAPPRSFKEIFTRHRRKGVQLIFNPPVSPSAAPSRFSFAGANTEFEEVNLQFDGRDIYHMAPLHDTFQYALCFPSLL